MSIGLPSLVRIDRRAGAAALKKRRSARLAKGRRGL